MKYIKSYENFKPIKINNAKPFKIKKNINKSMQHLQRGIKSLKGRIWDERDVKKRSDMNKEINNRVKKLGELNLKNLKQLDYLKNNPVKESRNNDAEGENSVDLLEVLSSPDFKPEDILVYMGLENDEYEVKTSWDFYTRKNLPKIDDDGINFCMKSSTLEDLMNIDGNFIQYILSFQSQYHDYDYYVDEEELNYIHGYLSGQTLENIKKLSILFDYEIDPEEEGEIKELLEYLCLSGLLDDIKSEISMENERAVEKSARALIKSLPFDLSYEYYVGHFNIEIYLEFNKIIEYLKEHKLKVSSIKELFENLYEASDFTYDFEYEGRYDYLNFDDVVRCVDNGIEQYLSNPDDLFVKIIEFDNIELFKKKIELANFSYVYDSWVNGNKKRLNLFELAKAYNNSILEWFQSYDFQYQMIDKSDAEIYKSLEDAEIINPKIKDEFKYLVDTESYNL